MKVTSLQHHMYILEGLVAYGALGNGFCLVSSEILFDFPVGKKADHAWQLSMLMKNHYLFSHSRMISPILWQAAGMISLFL